MYVCVSRCVCVLVEVGFEVCFRVWGIIVYVKEGGAVVKSALGSLIRVSVIGVRFYLYKSNGGVFFCRGIEWILTFDSNNKLTGLFVI